jgi:drug/metabolite transporter (DMT)-like permease
MLALFEPSAFIPGLIRPSFVTYAALMGAVYYVELIVWFYAVRHIDVSLASSITTPWPAFTMVLAAVILGDDIHAYQISAFVVVAASVYLLMLAGLQKARQPA